MVLAEPLFVIVFPLKNNEQLPVQCLLELKQILL